MSSLFGSSSTLDTTDQIILNTSTNFLQTTTTTTDALVIIDNQIYHPPTANLTTETVNDSLNYLADQLDYVSGSIDAPTVKNLYESNFNTNAFTDAFKTAVENIGDYIDQSELTSALAPYRTSADQDIIDGTHLTASDLTPYRTSADQDIIDGTHLTSSDLAPYRTSADQDIIDGTHLTSSDLVPYRTSADEDIINSGKLNTADLISDIIPHPVSGGGPATYEGTVSCGAFENGMNNINGVLIPQFSGLDIYDFSSNGVVNFKGSNYYSFNFGNSSVAFIKETAGVYSQIVPSVIFGVNPGNFVYKFATNGTILVAITKVSSTKFFWTSNGLTWNDYDISFNDPMRAIDIIDNVVYVGNNGYIYKITDVNNPSFESKSTSSNASKFFKYLTDVYYLVANGMYDYTSQTLVPGLPSLATQGDIVMSNAVVNGANIIYLITGMDNDIWKFIGSWALVESTDFETTYAITLDPYGNVLLGGYTTDESKYGILIADVFTSVPTGNDSNRQDSGNWYIYGFGDVYSGGGGAAGITVALDGGASVSANVFDTLVDLSTANDEVRASLGAVITSGDVATLISDSQDAQDISIASTYKSISSFNTDISAYLTTTNAGTTYRTIADSYSASGTDTAITNALAGYVTNTNLTTNYSTTSQMNTAITNANNTQDSSIALVYQTQAGMSAYYTSSQTNSAISSALVPYSTSAINATTYATLTQFGYLLRPNIKIVVASGGSTTPVPGQGYSTVESALASAIAGQVVFLCPATYTLSGPITIPAGVSIQGFEKTKCIISYTSTTSETMITLSSNTSISNLTIEHICSTNAIDISTIAITGTNNVNSLISECVITGYHNSILTGGIKLVNITATGVYTDPSIFTIKNCDMTVNSSTTGVNRTIHHTGSGTISIDSSQLSCVRSSGTGTNFIGAENTTGTLTITNSLLSGFTADISETGGSIRLGKSTVLNSPSANAKAFTILGGGWDWSFGDPATLANGTNYLYRGSSQMTANEVQYRVNKPSVLYGMYLNARLPAGVGNSTTITVRKNGVDTAATLALSGTATTATLSSVSVGFNSNDLISLKIVNVGSGMNTTQDIVAQLDFY